MVGKSNEIYIIIVIYANISLNFEEKNTENKTIFPSSLIHRTERGQFLFELNNALVNAKVSH